MLQVRPIAKDFNRLFADRCRARTEPIRRALEQQPHYEYLQGELSVAQGIQLQRLPLEPDLGPAVNIVFDRTPAQHVGGDSYDAFAVSPDEHCVAIGDVWGKGVPGSLSMVRTMTLRRTELLKDKPIHMAVGMVNAVLLPGQPGVHVRHPSGGTPQ